ncbi:SH3 domain-containing protein [candidate division WOR-3 bacterium]|nr:SH3 domain-containing protein [candidate division WOR-3 bacterium]
MKKFVIVFLSLLFISGCSSRIELAPTPLPYVTPSLETPEFWIDKLENPDQIILNQEEINELNAKTFERISSLVKVMKIDTFISSKKLATILQRELAQVISKKRYRYSGFPFSTDFYERLEEKIAIQDTAGIIPVNFGLTIKRTSVRLLPTQEIGMRKPKDFELNRFQYTSLIPFEPVAVLYFSKDRDWAYIQSYFVRGWVPVTDIAIGGREKIKKYIQEQPFLVIKDIRVNLYGDRYLESFITSLPMGTRVQLLKEELDIFKVKILVRKLDGMLDFEEGFLKKDNSVCKGYLPYTQRNALNQVFKALSMSYDWGGMRGTTDCSGYALQVYLCFGIILPRNSRAQLKTGIKVASFNRWTSEVKRLKALDRAIPGATILGFPGHIMLYLGKYNGRHYIIHNIRAFRKRRWFVDDVEYIGKVVVSDLSLGKHSKRRSLLQRLTSIRYLGK